MTERTSLSASQYEKFECLRRGVLEYVHGFKQPMPYWLPLGSRTHEIGEAYLKHGTQPNILEAMELTNTVGNPVVFMPGAIIEPALEFLPPPGTAIVEGDILCETPSSWWRGRRDFIFTPDSPRVIANGHVRVGDLKTTKGRKWVKTVEQMVKDVQANIYAYDLYENGAEHVDGLWIFCKTTGKPKAFPVNFPLEKGPVYDRVSEIDERAKIIHLLKQEKPNADDVPHNTSRCDDFGGCPHRNRGCKINVCEMFAKKGEVSVASILDRLKKSKIEGRSAVEELATARAEKLAEIVQEDAPLLAGLQATPIGVPESGFINPPKQEPYVGEFVQEDAPPLAYLAQTEATPDLDSMDRDQLKALCISRGLCDANDRRRADALRGLLRANETPTAAPEEPPAERESQVVARPKAAVKPIATLYIHCLPNYDLPTEAQTIVDEVLPKVLEAAGEAHPKLVAYGKGSALLSAALEEHVKASGYDSVFADRFLDADVLQTLVRLSSRVVRGF